MGDDEEAQRRRTEARRRYKKKHAKQISAYGRQYREEHADQIAEYKRQWRERNKQHRDAYSAEWRERNRERIRTTNREYMRRKAREAKAEPERRARKAEYARNRYHADVDASRAKAREYRDAARARDPEGYRETRKRHNATWRAKHKDEINSRLREKNRIDPKPKKEQARRYYERHAEERRAYSRRYHQEHREQQLARQRLWRQREHRRIAVGLPVRRLHRLTPAERQENARAADTFFSRPVTPQLLEGLEAELRTPPELIDAWHRETARIRATQYALQNPETGVQVLNRKKAEEERMDAIARDINHRLRVTPRTPRDPDPYLAPAPAPSPGGLSL